MSESAQGCVEVADLGGGLIAVRNSSDLSRAAHVYPVADWEEFLAYLRGERSEPARVQVNTNTGVIVLSDRTGVADIPHVYTAHEWTCFMDGVRKREPQLTAA